MVQVINSSVNTSTGNNVLNDTAEAAAENISNASQAAVENASNTLQQGAASAPTQDPGLLGPAIQLWESTPLIGKMAAVILAGALVAIYYWLDNLEDDDKLEATDWSEKFESMFKSPVENVGRPANTLLHNRTDVAGKRTIGVIKKIDKNKTNIGDDLLKEALDDDEEFEDLDKKDFEQEGVTYAVVKGSTGFQRFVNTILYKIGKIVSSGSNRQAEYFDLPLEEITVTGEGVEIKQDVKLVKEDGLWQSTSPKAQERLVQMTWLSTHQNWTESLQKQPEYYSDLNMNISGMKNIENTKSKNIRDFKKAEKKAEKEDAMN
jgi:hypothetical protein